MPQDLLQIALEHHRSGRLLQAEAIYRQLIAESGSAPAHHWLGVLLLQAGQVTESLPHLQRAVEAEPRDAAYSFNLGSALEAAGQLNAAVRTLSMAAELDGERAEIWLRLGSTLLKRGRSSDTALAIDALQRAVQKQPQSQSFYLLAIAQRQMGQHKEARKNLLKALEEDPQLAHGWFALASLDAAEGNLPQAASLLKRAIKIDPHFVAACEALARVLEQSGHQKEAATAHELAKQAREAKGKKEGTGIADLQQKVAVKESELPLHYALASMTRVAPPTMVPRDAVSGLFDKYADHFDDHLRGTLKYRAPELLIEAFMSLQVDRKLDILDLGCGTGICGPMLKPFALSLVGVDLSSAMLERAKERGVYDRLENADLVAFMRQAPGAFDLLCAADVLIYLGDFQPIFEAASACLRPGGYFAFTIEELPAGDRYELIIKTRRYRHSKAYVQKIAGMFGFAELRFENITIRQEANQPVRGVLIILQMPAA
jgi:predicted TPR repeat methyltransferase